MESARPFPPLLAGIGFSLLIILLVDPPPNYGCNDSPPLGDDQAPAVPSPPGFAAA